MSTTGPDPSLWIGIATLVMIFLVALVALSIVCHWDSLRCSCSCRRPCRDKQPEDTTAPPDPLAA